MRSVQCGTERLCWCLFRKLLSPHPNIIHSIDYSVETDKSDASAKAAYIFLCLQSLGMQPNSHAMQTAAGKT